MDHCEPTKNDDEEETASDGQPKTRVPAEAETKDVELVFSDSAGIPGAEETKLLYAVEDVPSYQTCLLLGFQHYLTMAGSTLPIPVLLCGVMCIDANDALRAVVISTTMFVSGFITLLQTTFGVRLPIVQGGSVAYMVPTVILLTSHFGPCPASTDSSFNVTSEAYEDNWKMRMSEVSGAIAVASLLQITLGLSGLTGLMLRWITPLAIVPTITLVGLALFDFAGNMAAENWGISILTILLILLFSQYLENIPIRWSRANQPPTKFYVFKLFPVLLAVLATWLLCVIGTYSGLFSEDSTARTDITADLLADAPWFMIPYPGQFGAPTVSVSSVVGIMIAVIASVIESIGDYYACAKISGASPPPVSAINRGIFIEGVGGILAGVFGNANGSTSFSQNIGIISITKVGSRRVVQFSALFMIIFGLFGKIGAIFMSIPVPIVGGILCTMFAVITGVGLSSLQYVNLNSPRNIYILGMSLFIGLAIPKWITSNEDLVKTGSVVFDQIITILLGTPMFLGGLVGFVLDNTIPGTAKDRGLIAWQAASHQPQKGEETAAKNVEEEDVNERCYLMPIGMKLIRRQKCLERIPISPTFNGFFRVSDAKNS